MSSGETLAIAIAAFALVVVIFAAAAIARKAQHAADAINNLAAAQREGNTIRQAATEEALRLIIDEARTAAAATARQTVVAGLDKWRTENGSEGRLGSSSGEHRWVKVASDDVDDPRGSGYTAPAERGFEATGVVSQAVLGTSGEHAIAALPPAVAILGGRRPEEIAADPDLLHVLVEYLNAFIEHHSARPQYWWEQSKWPDYTWYDAFANMMGRRYGRPLLDLIQQIPPHMIENPAYRQWADAQLRQS